MTQVDCDIIYVKRVNYYENCKRHTTNHYMEV